MSYYKSGLKTLAEAILTNAHAYEWSLQGMGMLRLHLPNHCRLHVWDSRYRVPNVSMIHDHLQWGLTSIVVAGQLTNRRYKFAVHSGLPYKMATLKPGVGCYFKSEPQNVFLTALPPEVYRAGDMYGQGPSVVHESEPTDGTVTFLRKAPTGDESACVFWPAGSEWVSAEPRRAEKDEVEDIVSYALDAWFKG